MSYGVKLEVKATLSNGGVFEAIIDDDDTRLTSFSGVMFEEARAAFDGLIDSLEHDGWFGETCPGCGENRIDVRVDEEFCAACEANEEDEDE